MFIVLQGPSSLKLNKLTFQSSSLTSLKGALSAIIVNVCYSQKLSDMIDVLIKRVSVTYKCYEMYAHRGKNVQLIVFWDRSRNGRHLINYRHCFTEFVESSLNQYNNALISYFLWICFYSVLITDKEPCKFAFNKRQNTNYSYFTCH